MPFAMSRIATSANLVQDNLLDSAVRERKHSQEVMRFAEIFSSK